MNKTARIPVALPPALRTQLSSAKEQSGLSFNAIIILALKGYLGATK